MLNHPLQSPKLQTLLTHLQTKLGQTQQTLTTWTKALSQQASNSINPTPPPQIPIQNRRAGQALLLILPAIALLLWNWKLLLALTLGTIATTATNHLQTRNLRPWTAGLRHWLNGPHRNLLLSLPLGGITLLSTYLITSLWDNSHDPWLVSCILLQSLGILLSLALLSAQFLNQQRDRHESNLDNTLNDLTHGNPINRLLAVRQLSRRLTSQQLNPDQTRIATQALQLLLAQETDTLVREATLRSLEPSLTAPGSSSLSESEIDTL